MADETNAAENFQAMTIPELQQELKRRGLKKQGSKPKLIQRLLEFMEKKDTEDDNTENHVEEEPEEIIVPVEPKPVTIEEPHPYNAEYEEQLIYDMSNEVTDEYNNHVNENGEVEADKERDMAEEFTKPIHEDGKEDLDERVIEKHDDVMPNESTDNIEESVLEEKSASYVTDEQYESFNEMSEEPANIDADLSQNNSKSRNSSHSKTMDISADILHNDNGVDEGDEALDYDEVVEGEEEPGNKTGDATVNETISDFDNSDVNSELPNLEVSALNDGKDHSVEEEDENGGVEEADRTNVNNEEEEKEEGELNDEELMPKIEKKPIVPVQLKKTRVSLQGSTESAEERAAKRKRRWGTMSIKEPTVTISSESIQKLIPDVKIDKAALEEAAEYDQQLQAELDRVMEIEDPDDTEDDAVIEVHSKEGVPERPRKPTGRTVTVDSGGKKVTLGKKRQSTDADTPVTIDDDKENAPKQVKTSKLTDEIEDEENRERSPSPPRHDASCFLHIANLVRPFTVNQLKALIQRTSTISEKGFWINNIKSHCYVKVTSEEEATATRNALHGLKWPSGTPKKLDVDFATNGRVYQETDGVIGVKEKVVIEIDDKDNEVEISDVIPGITENRRRSRTDRRSIERSRENKSSKSEKKQKEKSKKENRDQESPAKLLDDLFRKTKATPCIYWLPLSEEQILEKEKKRKQSDKTRHRNSSRDRRSVERHRHTSPRKSHNESSRPDRGWR